MTLANFIEQYIKEHDLTVRQFAAKCGLSHGILNRILTKGHRPNVETIHKIAEATGTNIVSLLRMAYPEAFKDEGLTVTSELVAQAFEGASEGIQEAILKLVGLK